MTAQNIGNELYGIVARSRSSLFTQGELAQLTFVAFEAAAANIRTGPSDEIEVAIPIGLHSTKEAMFSNRKFKRDELISRYNFLAFTQLSVNGIVQLVTIVEAMLGDVVRCVVGRYPKKLGEKRTVPMTLILECRTTEEIHLRATDILMNELSYKSPQEFADEVKSLLSINLRECPAFHRFMEIKATRDIHIHNRGFANATYIRKAGGNARALDGQFLPTDINYFLESFEACLQLSEWLERELHEKWHSSDYENYLREKTAAREKRTTAATVTEGLNVSPELPSLGPETIP